MRFMLHDPRCARSCQAAYIIVWKPQPASSECPGACACSRRRAGRRKLVRRRAALLPRTGQAGDNTATRAQWARGVSFVTVAVSEKGRRRKQSSKLDSSRKGSGLAGLKTHGADQTGRASGKRRRSFLARGESSMFGPGWKCHDLCARQVVRKGLAHEPLLTVIVNSLRLELLS